MPTRLSLAIAAYAHTHPVHVVTTTAAVLDLGVPAACPEPGQPVITAPAPHAANSGHAW